MYASSQTSLSPHAHQTQPAPLRYALYVRKSTEEDERQSQSIGSQTQQAHDLAGRTGLNIVQTFEEARSAKEPGRPEFNRLLLLIDAGEIDAILAWHPDRLSRNEMDAAAITMRVRRGVLKDMAFVSYFFHNSPEGVMMLQMALCQSQYMVSKLATDVKRGLQDKIKKGWSPHRAPLGYVNDKHKDKGNKTISPDSARFPLLRQAWEMLLTGAYSVPALQQIMTEEWGLRTPVTRSGRGGQPLSLSTLYRLFGSVFYAGCFVHDGVVHKGAHTPMVSLEEFDRVQQIIGKDNPVRPRSRTLAFTGLMRCGGCGGMVTGDVRVKPSGRAYTYYHCQGKDGCLRRFVPESHVEAQLEEHLARVELLPEFYEWALEEIEKTGAGQRAQREAVQAQQETAVRDADRKLAALLDMRLGGLLMDEEYRAKRSELTLCRERLREKVQQAQSGTDRAVEACRNAAAFMQGARQWLREGDAVAKRVVAQGLGSNYVLTDGMLLLEPHPMVARVGKVYKELEAKYRSIKPAEIGSGSTKKDALASIRTIWSGIWRDNYTEALERPLPFLTITDGAARC